MTRLYRRIYFAMLGVIIVTIVTALFAARLLFGPTGFPTAPADALLRLLAAELPEDADEAELAATLTELAREHDIRLSLLDAQGDWIASAGEPVRAPNDLTGDSAWAHHTGNLARWLRLDDGRWLGIGAIRAPGGEGTHLALLGLLLVVLAVFSYPIARRITRRLEHLKTGVEAWGAGELDARVEPKGKDEVTDLARAFNRAAERIEGLVDQQKRILASASHELRSPLTRLRMALELVAEEVGESELIDGCGRDIEELDGLVGDILLASRLDAQAPLQVASVDLRELIEEEADRVGATVRGERATIEGERAALRRMFRNLLENASRYSADVDVAIELGDDRLRVIVDDRGPGVSVTDRERIFEPFYRPKGHREGRDGSVGLGLALVQRIATAHGGRVFYEDRPGGGSRFVVELV